MEQIVQGSPEWFAARLGRATASRICDIVAKGKGSAPSASRANYMSQLICERLTGKREEGFTSAAMQWGTEKEPDARAAYQFYRDALVIEVGFVIHPRITMSGASPDGLVGEDGLVEIKCPNASAHIEAMIGQCVPNKYLPQMQWQMACTGRQWCDFVSFDPRMPEEMRLFIQRVERDAAYIADVEIEVSMFLSELDAKLARLRELHTQQRAA